MSCHPQQAPGQASGHAAGRSSPVNQRRELAQQLIPARRALRLLGGVDGLELGQVDIDKVRLDGEAVAGARAGGQWVQGVGGTERSTWERAAVQRATAPASTPCSRRSLRSSAAAGAHRPAPSPPHGSSTSAGSAGGGGGGGAAAMAVGGRCCPGELPWVGEGRCVSPCSGPRPQGRRLKRQQNARPCGGFLGAQLHLERAQLAWKAKGNAGEANGAGLRLRNGVCHLTTAGGRRATCNPGAGSPAGQQPP